MHDAAASVRTKKDASVVQCAQLVRDGKADAMVSAGNTGAAMAAALLRMGRIKGVARPADRGAGPGAGPSPADPGRRRCDGRLHAGVARAVRGDGSRVRALRLGIDDPKVGLLSNGEEAGKGDDLRKKVYPMLAAMPGFIGNVEGRDFMHDTVDVIVTDGFTGNVALKTIEGAIRGTARLVFDTLDSTPEVREAAAEGVMPALLAAAKELNPDNIGGAVLIGVDGVCVISHGSSSALAIFSAVERAIECVEAGLVERMKEAIADAG